MIKHLKFVLACMSLLGIVGACNGKEETGDTSAGVVAAEGVGVPCVPGDEARADFSGYAATEVNIEDRTTQCDTGICLAVYFQGRTDCPYGESCTTPSGAPVTVPVEPQLVARSPEDAVYCSCHCDGPEGTGPFCACPDGFGCQKLVPDLGLGAGQLAGSYCIKAGTEVSSPATLVGGATCDAAQGNCDGR